MKILAIVDPDRVDQYYYLKNDTKNDYSVLWFENESQNKNHNIRLPGFFKEEYYWNKFLTPKDLIKKIRPDRILLQQITDQRQIALIVYAQKHGIDTFYLDHGAAGDKGTAILRSTEKKYNFKNRLAHSFTNLFGSFMQVLKIKYYYYSNFRNLGSARSMLLYLKLPLLMLRYQPNKALGMCIFKERIPKYSIIFNHSNLEEYQLYTGIHENDVIFTGVPLFDHYFSNQQETKDHVVYIDHPMYEEKLLNWDSTHHKKIAAYLFNFANTKKVKIFVKLHPRSNILLWKSYNFDSPYFEIIQYGDFTELYLSSKLILGYSSSLLTGFLCAKKNIVNLGWHPEPQIFGLDFSKFDLCHKSLYLNELDAKFEYWLSTNLCFNNEAKYHRFLLEFNYPFDGKASERVIKAITNV